MASENIGGLYNTKMPGYDDAADIQSALKVFLYGSSTYDINSTDPTQLPNPSLARHLQDLRDDVDTVTNRGIGSSYSNLQPPAPIEGYIWVDGSSTQNNLPQYSAAVYSATEPSSPVDGVIWVDKNSNPPMAKVYNAGTEEWDLLNPLPALVDNAGDMIYASNDNVLNKLAIGSNGQVLKVSSGLPSWGSEKQWTLISSGSMSGSSVVSVSGISGEKIFVTLKDWSHDNTSETVMLTLRFNNDSGPNYVNTGGLMSASSLHSPLFSNTSSHDVAFDIDLANTAASLKPVSTIADNTSGQYFGYYKNTNHITSLQIGLSSTGQFDLGTYQVWSYE